MTPLNPLNPLNPVNPLIPSPFNNPIQVPNAVMPQTASLHLTQIEGFEPAQKFTDSTNTQWTLAKAATNSTVGIPDPKTVQIVDYWNHKFPREGLSQDVYVYVVEGVKQPTVETEQPMRVLYQWFSTTPVFSFTPQMISEKEWLKANVYSAPVADARVSKLYALCKVPPVQQQQGAAPKAADDDPFIKLSEALNASPDAERNRKPSRG